MEEKHILDKVKLGQFAYNTTKTSVVTCTPLEPFVDSFQALRRNNLRDFHFVALLPVCWSIWQRLLLLYMFVHDI